MARNTSALVTVWAVNRGREDDHAVELINSHHKASIVTLQEKHLQRRFLLPAPIARTVADLHFGGIAA